MENHHLWWIFPWKIVIFHSFLYVYQRVISDSRNECIQFLESIGIVAGNSWGYFFFQHRRWSLAQPWNNLHDFTRSNLINIYTCKSDWINMFKLQTTSCQHEHSSVFGFCKSAYEDVDHVCSTSSAQGAARLRKSWYMAARVEAWECLLGVPDHKFSQHVPWALTLRLYCFRGAIQASKHCKRLTCEVPQDNTQAAANVKRCGKPKKPHHS